MRLHYSIKKKKIKYWSKNLDPLFCAFVKIPLVMIFSQTAKPTQFGEMMKNWTEFFLVTLITFIFYHCVLLIYFQGRPPKIFCNTMALVIICHS